MNPQVEHRIAAVRRTLAEKQIDTFMVLVGENRRYLSGFTGEDGQFDETAGALFVTSDRLVLATDSRYELQAKNEAPHCRTVCYKKGLFQELAGILKDLGTRRLGFEGVRLTHAQFTEMQETLGGQGLTVDLQDLKDVVENLRVVKEQAEIDATRRALALAEEAFRNVVRMLKPGVTEKAVAWALEKGMREAGAEALSFPTIVAFGPNSALPHAISGDRALKPGEPILFDWGARLDGYCSDTSRTVILGPPDETFHKVHATVLEAQQRAIAAIRAGVSSKAVDQVARAYIDECGFAGKFGHGLGHGTGLAIHEAPRLSPIRDTVLEPGMLVTVEPGIYLPDWGGVRIENQVVVRENGAEVLNHLDTAYAVDSGP